MTREKILLWGLTLASAGSFFSPQALGGAPKPLERFTPVPASEPIPVIDFFRPALFRNPELNPAGTHFAAIVATPEDSHDLLTVELATKKIERITGGSEFDLSRFYWQNDQRLLFSLLNNKVYTGGLYVVDQGRFGRPQVIQRFSVVLPVGLPEKTPFEAIVWMRNSSAKMGSDGGLMRINTQYIIAEKEGLSLSNDDGMRAKVVKSYPTPKGGDPISYLADREGELAFAVTLKDGRPSLHRYVEDHWEHCPIDLEKFMPMQAGDKPGELLVLAPTSADKPKGLFRLDATTGTLGELLYQDEKYDLTDARIYRHPVDHHILGLEYQRATPVSVWLDPKYKAIQSSMEAALPHQVIRIIGSDRAEKEFFVGAASDVRPPSYYRVNMDKGTSFLVSGTAPWIDPSRMQPMQLMSFKTRDGFTITGYLTLPSGASKEAPAPLVVLPHGGPWARDVWGYDPEVQFLASRGYAVFQPNYRGSLGTEWMFTTEDQWAFRKMHNDVTDGVQKLLKAGLVDPRRIAIMGGSFGGYLALCGAIYEPDLYRCAVSISGVYDWENVIKQAKGSEIVRGQYGILMRKLGDPKTQRERFEEISPLSHIDQLKIPIFVAHGKLDPIANIAQSKQLLAELKKRNLPVQKHIESDEGHGFQHLENQVALYTEIEAFLAKNLALPPEPPKPAEVRITAHP